MESQGETNNGIRTKRVGERNYTQELVIVKIEITTDKLTVEKILLILRVKLRVALIRLRLDLHVWESQTTTLTVVMEVLLNLPALHFDMEVRGHTNKRLEVDKENFIANIQSDRINTL